MSGILANLARPSGSVSGQYGFNAALKSVDPALKYRSRKYALVKRASEKYGAVTSWLERAQNIASLFDDGSRFADRAGCKKTRNHRDGLGQLGRCNGRAIASRRDQYDLLRRLQTA